MKAAVWFLLGLVLIVLLVFGRQIMLHVGAGNPLIRLCRFVGALLSHAKKELIALVYFENLILSK